MRENLSTVLFPDGELIEFESKWLLLDDLPKLLRTKRTVIDGWYLAKWSWRGGGAFDFFFDFFLENEKIIVWSRDQICDWYMKSSGKFFNSREEVDRYLKLLAFE